MLFLMMGGLLKVTSIYLLSASIAALTRQVGIEILMSLLVETLLFLRFVRVALKLLTTINRDTFKKINNVHFAINFPKGL
jgi:hypothetical protein